MRLFVQYFTWNFLKILFFALQNEKSGRSDDDLKRDQMEKLVREELERWDSEASMNRADSRGPSPSASRVNTAKSGRSPSRSSAQSSAGSVRVPVRVSILCFTIFSQCFDNSLRFLTQYPINRDRGGMVLGFKPQLSLENVCINTQ